MARKRSPKIVQKTKSSRHYFLITIGNVDESNISKGAQEDALYRLRHPEKLKAQRLAQAAIKRGQIKREPCKICQDTYRVVAHHEDYNKPLDVIFLCYTCHAKWHARVRKQERLAVEFEAIKMLYAGTSTGLLY